MNPGSSVQAVAIRPVIDTRADDMRMIQASTVTSDLEVARKGAHIAVVRITWLEDELDKKSKKLSQLEQILISQAAAQRARRKIGGKTPVLEIGLLIPRPLLIEGEAIHRSAHITARVFFMFFSTYDGDPIWDVPEVITFKYNDVKQRWNEELPQNRLFGQALELLKATDPLGEQWIRRKSLAFKQQFQSSISDARSETIKRTRDNGPEIFEDIRSQIDNTFTLRHQRGEKTLTYTKLTQDPVPLHGFCKDLFLPESAGARGEIPGLLNLLGISWDKREWQSDPVSCALMYKNYKVVAGEEFESELLFRICRAVVYGPASIRKKTKLTLNGKSPLVGFPLCVTPGLIVNMITIARLALSPDETFSSNGVGPNTKIRYVDDAEDLLEGLMSIWDTPRGRAIQEAWKRNVFPSQSNQPMPAPMQPITATQKRRTKAALQLAAHVEEARLAQEVAAQVVAQHVHQHESYWIPSNGFDITTHHAPNNGGDEEEDDYGDLVTQTFAHRGESSDEEEEDDNSNLLAEFDESAGEVKLTRERSQPVRQPASSRSQLEVAVDFNLAATSTPPRRPRPTTSASTAQVPSMASSPISSTSPPRQPSRTLAFLTQPSSVQQASSSSAVQPNPPEVPATSAVTYATVPSTKEGPKPRRVLSRLEREALALAGGDAVELAAVQEAPRRRSTRNTGPSSSTFLQEAVEGAGEPAQLGTSTWGTPREDGGGKRGASKSRGGKGTTTGKSKRRGGT